jgi:hypothetical protein
LHLFRAARRQPNGPALAQIGLGEHRLAVANNGERRIELLNPQLDRSFAGDAARRNLRV